MIIVKLIGGLGNQMFQYAAGKFLAARLGTDLFFDISGFAKEGYTKREYALDVFDLTAKFASQNEINKLKYINNPARYYWHRLNVKINPFYKSTYFREKQFNYMQNILDLFGDVYMEGQWQTEKYFSSQASQIIKDFTPRNASVFRKDDWYFKIKNTNSVSIHIRRGDYVSCPKFKKYFYTMTPSYYQKSLKMLAKKTGKLVVFIFGKDQKWARKFLKFPLETFYIKSGKGEHDAKDMWLMSQCKHNIIANSSFSWWGAWLNQNPNKIVVAPQKWFKDSSINTSDLIPEKWIKI